MLLSKLYCIIKTKIKFEKTYDNLSSNQKTETLQTFSQKFNRERHAKNIHQEDTLVLVHDVTEADESAFNDLVDFNAEEPYEIVEITKSYAFPVNENHNASQNDNDEILNASFISDTGEVMDVKMSIIDKDTRIYQVCENDGQFNRNCNYENLEATSITFDDIEEQMNQSIPTEPLDMLTIRNTQERNS